VSGKRTRRRREWAWVYQGRDLAGTIEQEADGAWDVRIRGEHVGYTNSREGAIALVRKLNGQPGSTVTVTVAVSGTLAVAPTTPLR
jgi:hypothetical protein